MNPPTLNTADLLRELRHLDLIARAQGESVAACSDPRQAAALLVEAGTLTAYQAEQVLAGQGRALHVGPYVLRARLGRGGMGHVYQAEHRLLKRVAALKIAGRVHRAGGDLAALRRFYREAEAAGRLRHPGIVSVHDAGESAGRLYLAMEYIEGIDLEQFVRRTGPLPIDLAREIVRQTAAALGHAHAAGLIHRDIKPSNLMLTPPGVTVKLLDLGLAQLADASWVGEDGTREEGLCGTPDFMAPEWGRDPRTIDARSDLYSLGCTFYYLLTGQVPFPGGSWTEKLLRHSLEAPACVQALRPDVPAEIAAVIERLMARECVERFGCAAEVLAALTSSPPAAPSNEPAAPARRRRKPRRFSCAALVAILLGVAAAGGARWIVTPPPVAPPSHGETPRELPFRIAGRGAAFSSLEKAIVAAHDGDIITIHGTGPFVSRPLSWQGKALTLRSADGVRPRLELRTDADPWQALFRTDRMLALEGLELALAAGASAAPLVYSEQASLHLTDCRIVGGAEEVAILARNPEEVILNRCRIDAGAVGLSVEVGAKDRSRIELVDNTILVRAAAGAALSLWAPDVRKGTAVRVELEGNTMQAGRIAALRAVSPGLAIAARGNRFTYRETLLDYAGDAGDTAWRESVWQGENNTCIGPPARRAGGVNPLVPKTGG